MTANSIDIKKLKEITDRFIEIIEDLHGYLIDSERGYAAYRRELATFSQSNYTYLTYANNDNPTEKNSVILHHAPIKKIVARNSEEDLNVNRTRCHLIVMIYAHWEEDIRPKLAERLNKKEKNEIKCEIMHELKKIRQDILHNRGKVLNSANNKFIKFEKGSVIYISKQMLEIFRLELFKYLNGLFIEFAGKTIYPDSSFNQEAKKTFERIMQGYR